MQEPPKRTRWTDLTDDELLLFDLLFDGYHSMAALAASVYPVHLNIGYTHSIPDEDLPSMVVNWESSGLIWKKQISRSDGTQLWVLTLSEVGRELWERERNPDWKSFVVTLQRELGMFPTGSQVIYCLDESVGRRCAGAMFASGIVTPISRIRVRKVGAMRLIPGKSFEDVIALRFRTSDHISDSSRPDYDLYEQCRCWWKLTQEIRHAGDIPGYQVAYAPASSEWMNCEEL